MPSRVTVSPRGDMACFTAVGANDTPRPGPALFASQMRTAVVSALCDLPRTACWRDGLSKTSQPSGVGKNGGPSCAVTQ